MENKQTPTGDLIGIGVMRDGMPCGIDITRLKMLKINMHGMKFSIVSPLKIEKGDTIELIFESKFKLAYDALKEELPECSS
jgi:hypothetical protein